MAPAAVGQAVAPGEHQQAATAAIHEVLQDLMLLGAECRRLEAADDHRVVCEQLLGFLRKALLELARRLDALAVVAVRRGSHEARDAQ